MYPDPDPRADIWVKKLKHADTNTSVSFCVQFCLMERKRLQFGNITRQTQKAKTSRLKEFPPTLPGKK